MESNIVITDSNKFEELIRTLEESYKRIQDIISFETRNVERINQTRLWTGPCAASLYNKYKQLNGNYQLVDYSLDIYIRFLKKTLQDYTRMEEEVGKNIDNMATTLDVNA